jgi:hypothetical protein
LFEGGFELFDDLLRGNVGIEEVGGFFEAFVTAPEDVEAGYVAIMKLIKSRKILRSRITSPLARTFQSNGN